MWTLSELLPTLSPLGLGTLPSPFVTALGPTTSPVTTGELSPGSDLSLPDPQLSLREDRLGSSPDFGCRRVVHK